jgi:HSP20 family molecular chaperone IbpA
MAEKTIVRNSDHPARVEATRNARFVMPRVDIFETESELLLFADLPGVNSQDIDLRYERGELILRGKVAPPAPHGQPLLEEFETGDFYRVFQIHEMIDASKIVAEAKNGVLTVHLPKQEAVKPKQVKVQVG